VVFTILLILVVLYWLSVIVGALDIDLFGADGLAEGAADGVADGLDASDGLLAAFFSSLNLRKAPVTVVASLLVLYAWVINYFGLLFLPQMVEGVPGLVWSVSVPLVSVVVSLLATSVSIKPIAPMFEVHTSRAQETIVGREVIIHTLSVDARHGQAYYKDGGADLLLKVRCQSKNNLTKGSRALVIDYNKLDHVYFVEPMDQLLGDGGAATRPADDAIRELEQELAQSHAQRKN
jgi:hypothetical protein